VKRDLNHFYGCLIGGAIGDALGAPVEFLSLEEIQKKYGENGICELQTTNGVATVTEDTQMTLFTAEGLLRGITRQYQKEQPKTLKNSTTLVFRAYLRWLYTQGLSTPHWGKEAYDGWLIRVSKLHAYREPGVTCLTSLGKGIMGTLTHPLNESKGCGTVIRVAPVGLLEDEIYAYDIGCHIGAITHGHPTAYIASGALAQLICYLIEGDSLAHSLKRLIKYLEKKENTQECLEKIKQAVQLATDSPCSLESLQQLGGGFLADEALAIGIYCALSYENDFKQAIILATNHDGDSDSTAAITGNILGAYLGADHIDSAWQKPIELKKELYDMAGDLLIGYEETDRWQKRYPGW
jgi:ADP-ribosylglycohydrolase